MIKASLNLIYKVCGLVCAREDAVLLLSRQSDSISLDYQILVSSFEARGFATYCVIGKLEKGHLSSYAFRVLKEIKLLAKCKICFLDGYDPVVSMLNLRCEKLAANEIELLRREGLQEHFPALPVVIQLWHAFGAFKKFGYQSLGSKEGRSVESAKLFEMHKNYSWIICSGESCRKPFAEAFRYPLDRVLPLGRPEMDVLFSRGSCSFDLGAGHNKPRVLFAPTLRRSTSSSHPFRVLYESGKVDELSDVVDVLWAFHPVEDDTGSAEGTRRILADSDCVVTDYSSIVYEAYLLGKRIFFYVPDIEEYRSSPGLNEDPLEVCPEDAFLSSGDLIKAIRCWASEGELSTLPRSDYFACKGVSALGRKGCRVDEIVDFAISCVKPC